MSCVSIERESKQAAAVTGPECRIFSKALISQAAEQSGSGGCDTSSCCCGVAGPHLVSAAHSQLHPRNMSPPSFFFRLVTRQLHCHPRQLTMLTALTTGDTTPPSAAT